MWTGELRGRGFYRYTDERGVWELHYRRASRTERAGHYLYGPEGTDVVAEYVGEKLAQAQRNAAKFTAGYLDVPDTKASDALWAELLEKEENGGSG